MQKFKIKIPSGTEEVFFANTFYSLESLGIECENIPMSVLTELVCLRKLTALSVRTWFAMTAFNNIGPEGA